jgi:hypothetical protein
MKLIRTQRFGNRLCYRPQVIKKVNKNGGGGATQLGPLERANLSPQMGGIGPTVCIYIPHAGLWQGRELEIDTLTVTRILLPQKSKTNGEVKIQNTNMTRKHCTPNKEVPGDLN